MKLGLSKLSPRLLLSRAIRSSLFYAGWRGSVSSTVSAAVTYLLNAPFTASNQTFTNAQVLDTTAEGVTTGSLTVVDTSTGVVEIDTNKIKLTGTNNYSTTGVTGDAVTRAIGLALFTKQTNVTSNSNTLTSFADSQTFTSGGANIVAGYGTNTSGDVRYNYGTGAVLDTNILVGSISADTETEFCIMLGGYDSGGVPYKSGDTKANFTYGMSLFQNISSTWTLLYRQASYNVATLYPRLMHYQSTLSSKHDDFRIPDADLSANLLPTVLDTFTDTNGTALTAHTPDVDTVGSGWSQYKINGLTLGDDGIDIQSNKANFTDTGSPDYWSYVIDSGKSDVFVECVFAFTGINGNGGITLRHSWSSDVTESWEIQLSDLGNLFRIVERSGGTATERASTSFSPSTSTDYRITAVAEGATITAYLDDGNSITYGSATNNQTVTTHGIFQATGNVDCTWDNFAIYPRSGYTDLDNY